MIRQLLSLSVIVISTASIAQTTEPDHNPAPVSKLSHSQLLYEVPSIRTIHFGNAFTTKSITPPTATVTSPCDTGSAQLVTVSTSGMITWSTDSLGTNVIGTDDTLTTGTLTADTSYYLTTIEVTQPDSTLPLPAHSSDYSVNVRGYYFTAPSDFVIKGLWVPTEADAGTQNVAIVRFDNQTPPPLWSSTTNAFQSLGYWPNYNANDTIWVDIPIAAGDVIGIYGNRSDVNSYAPAPAQSMINGTPVTLTRSGMQLPLSTNPMSNIFSETGGSISRVEFFYSIYDTCTVQVDVPVYQSSTINQSYDFCQGDSVMYNGMIYASDTVIVENLFTINGCDSTVTTTLIANPLPTVTLASFSNDSICSQYGPVALPAGTPAGGMYSGTGVSGSNFDPGISGMGSFDVTYQFVDTNGCMNSAMSSVVVVDCASLSEQSIDGVTIYPNPVQGALSIELNGIEFERIYLQDAMGRVVANYNEPEGLIIVDCNPLASGVYFVVAQKDNKVQSQKIIKK